MYALFLHDALPISQKVALDEGYAVGCWSLCTQRHGIAKLANEMPRQRQIRRAQKVMPDNVRERMQTFKIALPAPVTLDQDRVTCSSYHVSIRAKRDWAIPLASVAI